MSNLLIITQKVDKNDPILGFFHRWIEEFAKHYEKVTVICLEKGEYDLPENVKVLSLGKEKKNNFQFSIFNFQKLKYIWRFYKYIYRERKNYDTVFVHMNPIYVVLGGLFWRIWKKKISLWYAHGSVSFSLRIAEKLSNIIITSTISGFRLKSKKIHVVGQGINIEKFKQGDKIQNDNMFRIISIGRISPVKDYETLIKAVDILEKDNIKISVEIIGGAGLPSQEKYLFKLKKIVEERDLGHIISFVGAISNRDIVKYLRNSNIFVNTSHTGSLDKAVLEAMAVGLPIVTCNEALSSVLGDLSDFLMFTKGDNVELSKKIKFIANMKNSDRISLGQDLRKIVKENHNLVSFIDKISNIIK